MDSRDFFHRFFGFPSRRPFDQDGDHLDGHSQGDPLFQGLEGMFEHFHNDMKRQMDAMRSQMEDMEAGFGAIDFPSSFGQPSPLKPMEPPDQDNAGQVFIWSNTPSPFFGPRGGQQTTPRDFMLKDGTDLDGGMVGPPSGGGGRAKDDSVFPVPGWNKQNKGDTDLDGKISDSKILDMIQKPSQGIQTHTDPSKQGFFSSSSKSVSVSTFKGPNSKFEHKRTVRDSAGHEESTVTRSLGDKSYTVTSVTGRDGLQERRETYKNMDEKDVSKFEEDWKRSQHPSPAADNMMSARALPGPADPHMHPGLDPADMDLFSKFFDTRRR